MTGHYGVCDFEKPSAKSEDRGHLYSKSGPNGPLVAGMSEEHRKKIHQIRSIVVSRKGSTVHSEYLIAMLEHWLFDEEQKAALAGNALNFFYLHAAAYLKSEKNILGDRAVLEVLEPSQVLVITKIVRIASQQVERWCSSQSFETDTPYPKVPVTLLGGALALAERLDLHQSATLGRIHSKIIRFSDPLKKSWPRRFHIESIGPHPYEPHTVLVRIHCRDAELHRGLKHYETETGRFLSNLNELIRPRFLFSKVRFEIRADGYEPIDYKFAVDGSAALQLFMGNTLYSDKRVFLRELVQNAVDACHLRSLIEPDYTPTIDVQLNETEDIISIKDNGIGMDRYWLEKYFLNIGISFYRSGELGDIFGSSGLQMDFISNFGIGFLSTFLVARRIIVRTRKQDSQGLLITISDIGDYFDVRQAKDHLPIGTEVILELKPSRIKSWRGMEYLGYLKSNARFVTIPIQFNDAQSTTTVIGCEPLDSFGSSSGTSGRSFSANIQIHPSQGYLMIRTRGDIDRIFSLDSASGGISIFQNGIFVTQTDDLLPAMARGYVVGRINLIGRHMCDLSMDRNRIFWRQDQLRLFRRSVLQSIANASAQMLRAVENKKVAPEVRLKIERTIASFFEFTAIDDKLFAALYPEIQRVIRQHFRSFLRTSVSRSDQQILDLPAIVATQGFHYKWQESVAAAMVRKHPPKT